MAIDDGSWMNGKECWINVYSPPPYCFENLNRELYNSKLEALYSDDEIKRILNINVSYRIHVKMKEVKGYSREYHYIWKDGKHEVIKPSFIKPKIHNIKDGKHWMDI